jgi:hypothetical protein
MMSFIFTGTIQCTVIAIRGWIENSPHCGENGLVCSDAFWPAPGFEDTELGVWPAPGFEDTELGVLMEPEVGHGETKIYARVQT